MNANDAVGDGEAETGTARFTVAIVSDAIEQLEDVDELRLRNALPVIANEKTNERTRA